MQKFPHHYHVTATGQPTGTIVTETAGVPVLHVAAPKQFDGPGDQWSPEDMLVAAVADCLILTFRAVASASKLEWKTLSCEVKAVLDRVEHKTRFTEIQIHASLKISSQADREKSLRLLQKAEESCLITNSLTAETHLTTDIIVK